MSAAIPCGAAAAAASAKPLFQWEVTPAKPDNDKDDGTLFDLEIGNDEGEGEDLVRSDEKTYSAGPRKLEEDFIAKHRAQEIKAAFSPLAAGAAALSAAAASPSVKVNSEEAILKKLKATKDGAEATKVLDEIMAQKDLSLALEAFKVMVFLEFVPDLADVFFHKIKIFFLNDDDFNSAETLDKVLKMFVKQHVGMSEKLTLSALQHFYKGKLVDCARVLFDHYSSQKPAVLDPLRLIKPRDKKLQEYIEFNYMGISVEIACLTIDLAIRKHPDTSTFFFIHPSNSNAESTAVLNAMRSFLELYCEDDITYANFTDKLGTISRTPRLTVGSFSPPMAVATPAPKPAVSASK